MDERVFKPHASTSNSCCQLNVKVMSRKELKFLANSKSHLKMTQYPQNL
jgi:hypothetical protein